MRKYIWRIVGVVFTCIGLGIVVFTLHTHLYAVSASDAVVSKYVTYEDVTESVPKVNKEIVDSDLFSFATEDMKVKKVTKLTNCMVIDTLGIQAPIMDDIDKKSLAIGVGHFPETAKLGEVGNCCVAGHSSTIYNCIFNDLYKIKFGDMITCYDSSGKEYNYGVVSTDIVDADATYVLNQDTLSRMLTIVTCTDNGSKRLIVRAVYKTGDELRAELEAERKERKSFIMSCLEDDSDTGITSYVSHKYKLLRKKFGKGEDIETSDSDKVIYRLSRKASYRRKDV